MRSSIKELIENGFPRSISLQKFNDYLKEVCEIAGIDTPTNGKRYDTDLEYYVSGLYPKHELVSSHICRRSFATNSYGKIPTAIIMRLTGHASEAMLLKYIGLSENEGAEMADEYFEKLDALERKTSMLNVVKTAG